MNFFKFRLTKIIYSLLFLMIIVLSGELLLYEKLKNKEKLEVKKTRNKTESVNSFKSSVNSIPAKPIKVKDLPKDMLEKKLFGQIASVNKDVVEMILVEKSGLQKKYFLRISKAEWIPKNKEKNKRHFFSLHQLINQENLEFILMRDGGIVIFY
ncbi:MAG: hypothetical protein ACTSXD_03870 [Candidatus Heimdallarchaeaceae archaeon]